MRHLYLYENYENIESKFNEEDWEEEDFNRNKLIELVNDIGMNIIDKYDYVLDKMNKTTYKDLNGYITGEYRSGILKGDALINEYDHIIYKNKLCIVKFSKNKLLSAYDIHTNKYIGIICGLKGYNCIISSNVYVNNELK